MQSKLLLDTLMSDTKPKEKEPRKLGLKLNGISNEMLAILSTPDYEYEDDWVTNNLSEDLSDL